MTGYLELINARAQQTNSRIPILELHFKDASGLERSALQLTSRVPDCNWTKTRKARHHLELALQSPAVATNAAIVGAIVRYSYVSEAARFPMDRTYHKVIRVKVII